MTKEEKTLFAKTFFDEKDLEKYGFSSSRIEEINADYFAMPNTRGSLSLIVADDGSYLVCSSIRGFNFWKEEFKNGKRTSNFDAKNN